jgi:hypothetical protein
MTYTKRQSAGLVQQLQAPTNVILHFVQNDSHWEYVAPWRTRRLFRKTMYSEQSKLPE